MAEKYKISLWENYMKTAEVGVEDPSSVFTPTGSESPLYFYFQYPPEKWESSSYRINYRARFNYFEMNDPINSSQKHINLVLTNQDTLRNNDIKFLISRQILTCDKDGYYETSANNIILQEGDKIRFNGEDYIFQGVDIGLYYTNSTYYSIQVLKNEGGTISTDYELTLKKGYTGMIWYAAARLQKGDEISHEVLVTYNLSDYKTALDDLEQGINWLVVDSQYYYANWGLSFLDAPSDINDYFKGNNRLSLTVQDYGISYKGLDIDSGAQIKIDDVYYNILSIDENGIQTTSETNSYIRFSDLENSTVSLIIDYTDERNLLTVTESEMRAFTRGRDPKLKVNINGTKELSFNLYYWYIDNSTGNEIRNPLISKIVNESKIKVQWDEEWYDFVVKDIKEDTSQKYISYTCKDLFIHELSKNGYSVELDDELMNNQGTIQEIGTEILKGSDWKVAADSDLIYQYLDEPLHILKQTEVTNNIAMKSYLDGIPYTGTVNATEVGIVYSSLAEDAEEIVCLYPINNETMKDKDGLVLTSPKIGQYIITSTGISTDLSINTELRGRRIVKSQKTQYDSLVEKNVLLYEDDLHGWFQTKFKNPISIQNLFVNYKDFKNTTGWYEEGSNETITIGTNPHFEALTNPRSLIGSPFLDRITATGSDIAVADSSYTLESGDYVFEISNNSIIIYMISALSTTFKGSAEGNITLVNVETGETVIKTVSDLNSNFYCLKRDMKSYLKIYHWDSNNHVNVYRNKGLHLNAHYLDEGLQPNQLYVFRYKMVSPWPTGHKLKLSIVSDYVYIRPEHPYLVYQNGKSYLDEEGYMCDFYKVNTDAALSREQIVSEKWEFALEVSNESPYTDYHTLYEVQFFEVCMCEKDGVTYMIRPGEIEKEPLYQTYFYLYSKPQNQYAISKDEISYLYAGPIGQYRDGTDENRPYITYSEELETLLGDLGATPVLTPEKVTSISGKESNRYNLIQSACEKFQCWAQFVIRHDPTTGKILTVMDLESDDNEPIRQVRFKKDLTTQKGISFTDGLDLNSISKTLTSQDIVTKMYVKPNQTDVAEDGIVTIAKAEINPLLDTYILNFDYYIAAGLLDGDMLQNDLWGNNTSSMKFYPTIRALNTKYDIYATERARILSDLDENYSFQQVYRNYVESLEEEMESLQQDIIFLVNDAKDSNGNAIKCGTFSKALEYILTQNFKKDSGNIIVPPEIVYRFLTYVTLNAQKFNYSSKLKEIDRLVIKLEAARDELTLLIQQVLSQKAKVEEVFYRKYGAYIFEGVWNSSDYIDNNKYYYDAVNVSYTSARPTIKYTFNVIRLAALEEYKERRIQVGDIDYVQHSKLFGYEKDGITPLKEKVVISEIIYNLDSPEKDTVTVQNYRTQFEDLLSRIAASVQTPKYAPAQYINDTRAQLQSPNLPTYKV